MSTYSALVIADGATSYWRLGGVPTDSVNGRNGTAVNSPTPATGLLVGDVTGNVLLETGDKLLLEDGSSFLLLQAGDDDAYSFVSASLQYIEVADNDAFSIVTTGKLSVEMWVNVSSFASEPAFVAKGSAAGTTREWKVYTFGADLRVGVYDAAGTIALLSLVQTLLTSTTYHIVATFDDALDQLFLYVNGRFVGSQTTWARATTNLAGALRFANDFDVQYLDGAMDEIAIYPTVLTSDQIWNHYSTGVAFVRKLNQLPQLVAQ